MNHYLDLIEIFAVGSNNVGKRSDCAPVNKRPIVFCVEGVAGAGKTTLCHEIQRLFRTKAICSKLVPEFSQSELGEALAIKLDRATAVEDEDSAFEDFLACTTDKYESLNAVLEAGFLGPVIVDRGFITQRVLSIPLLRDPKEILEAGRIVTAANEWLKTNFEATTCILAPPIPVVVRRLEGRFGRSCSPQELIRLQKESAAYVAIGRGRGQPFGRVHLLSTALNVSDIAVSILEKLWKWG